MKSTIDRHAALRAQIAAEIAAVSEPPAITAADVAKGAVKLLMRPNGANDAPGSLSGDAESEIIRS